MSRYIFQTAIVNKDGLYSYELLTLEQASAWLANGPEPLFRMPLITDVIQTLVGKNMGACPDQRLYLHTGDEALIMVFAFPEYQALPAYKRGIAAAQPRSMSLTDVRASVHFGLLRKFARLDHYVLSISQWDSGFRDRRWRYLVHDAVLSQYGIYQFGRVDVSEAVAWLDEGPYESQLRYDVTCKALELVTNCDVTMWNSYSLASLSMEPGDQALVVYFHSPEATRPRPFEPFTGTLSPAYVRQHTNLSVLTRLSNEFIERNRDAFPIASMITAT
jgi:hypothetical protein